jgi:hypothetical protein
MPDCIRKGRGDFAPRPLRECLRPVRSGWTRAPQFLGLAAVAAAAAAKAFLASAGFLLFASEIPSSMLTSSSRFRFFSAIARCAALADFG